MNETEIGIFLGQNLSKTNLDKASSLEQDCPEKQIRGKFNDGKTCKHNFELIKRKKDGEFVKKQQCKKATRV